MDTIEHGSGSSIDTGGPVKKTPLIIRPDHRTSKPRKRRGAAPRLNRKQAAKLGANLLGVCILLVAVGVFMAQASGSFKKVSHVPVCIGQQLCLQSGTGSTGLNTLTLRSTPTGAQHSVTPAVSGIGTHLSTPTPAAPTATPTSIFAQLIVQPASITIPHYSYCSTHKLVMPIQLQDAGGQPVIWRQGTKTSPGLSITVSPNSYLIEPGQTVKVRLFCSPIDVKGHYHLQIEYNAGVVNIPVFVASRT